MTSRNYDSAYVSNAMRVTSVSIPKNDFYSLTHKESIREVFMRQFIKETPGREWDWDKVIINRADVNDINRSIRKFKEYVSDFKLIFNYPFKGPGEVLLYLIIESAVLKSDRDGEVDLSTNSGNYQIKSATTNDELIKNIRTGGIDISDIAVALKKLKAQVGLKEKPDRVLINDIAEMKVRNRKAYDDIEEIYQDRAYREYFSKFELLVFNSKAMEATIIKDVKKSDIGIERYTDGIIKPTIKIK